MKKLLNLKRIRTYSLNLRPSKVHEQVLARPQAAGARFKDFWSGLPDVLAAKQLKELVQALINAKKENRCTLLMFGAHLIKCGLSPMVVELMRRGWIKALATNGASAIHDFELSVVGKTSEDVAEGLKDGRFGMARETGVFINASALQAARRNRGLGEVIGERIHRSSFPHKNTSLFATAFSLGLPATIHAAIGTDIVHQQPGCDGAAWGKATYTDFIKLATVVSGLDRGVVLNFGSAVILPEVFLKALTIARNLRHKVERITAANFDMIPQYRPRVNVVQRPTAGGGRGFLFSGHHEIMFPLLYQALVESSP